MRLVEGDSVRGFPPASTAGPGVSSVLHAQLETGYALHGGSTRDQEGVLAQPAPPALERRSPPARRSSTASGRRRKAARGVEHGRPTALVGPF